MIAIFRLCSNMSVLGFTIYSIMISTKYFYCLSFVTKSQSQEKLHAVKSPRLTQDEYLIRTHLNYLTYFSFLYACGWD